MCVVGRMTDFVAVSVNERVSDCRVGGFMDMDMCVFMSAGKWGNASKCLVK